MIFKHFKTKHDLDLEPAKHTNLLTEEQERQCEARFNDKKFLWVTFRRAGDELDLESPFEICSSVDEK